MPKANTPDLDVSGRLIEAAKANPVKFVHKLIAEARPKLQAEAERWKRYRSKYRMALRYLDNPTTMPLAFPANYVHSNVETVKASIPRDLPEVTAKAIDVDNEVVESIISRILAADLFVAGLPGYIKMAIHHAALTGLAWFNIGIDPTGYYSQPVNSIEVIPPERVYVDPDAVPFWGPSKRINARYIIKEKPDTYVEEVEGLFGIKIDLDDDEEEIGDSSDSFRKDESAIGTRRSLYECWLNTFDDKKPWYRIILWGNKLVKQEKSPFNHKYPSLIPVFDVFDDGADNFYQAPVGEVEEIEPLQDKANALDAAIYKNIRQIINRQRVINLAMGLRVGMVDNSDNRVYGVSGDPRAAMSWDAPPQLSTDVYTFRMAVDYLLEVVSGVTGTQAGRKPTGIQAAKAIAQLSQNSDRRITTKRDDLLFALTVVAEIAMSNIFQFYDQERFIRLGDSDVIRIVGDYPKSLTTNAPPVPEGMTEEEFEDLVKREYRKSEGIDLVLSDVKGNYALSVDYRSVLPENRADLAQLAADLFRLGAIDRQALLEMLDWPNRHEILQRQSAAATGPQVAQQAKQEAQQPQSVEELMAMLGAGGGAVPNQFPAVPVGPAAPVPSQSPPSAPLMFG